MNYRDTAAFTFRLVGALVLFELLAWYPSTVLPYVTNGDRSWGTLLGIGVVPSLFPLMIGLALVLFPASISNRVFRFDGTEPSQMSEPAWMRVVFVALGVYFIFRSLSDLTFHIATLVQVSLLLPPGESLFPNVNMVASLVATIVEFIIGAVLVLGREGLVTALLKFRGRA